MKMIYMIQSTARNIIAKYADGHYEQAEDILVVEEPLEIKLAYNSRGQQVQRSLAVTMRTPGQDDALALGFLLSEGIIGHIRQIVRTQHIGQRLDPGAAENILLVELHKEVKVDFESLNRHFYTSSSCGICGKASIEMVKTNTCYFPRPDFPVISPGMVRQLPERLRNAQTVFEDTGGIHAAALFDASGNLLFIQEDVGRHNALDKLIGLAMQEGIFPLREHIILLSGRISFELVQKALMAGVPIIAAIGAPSSLAVELADEYGMTLIGFLRNERFNVYGGWGRVAIR
jgi:FdhD protein